MEQIRESLITVASVPTQLVGADATRLSLLFMSQAGISIYISTNPGLVSGMTQGGLLIPTTIPYPLTRQNVRVAVTYPWYAIVSASPSSTVYVLEIYDLSNPYPDGKSPSDESLTQFTTDPHQLISGIDVPDRIVTLTSELLHMRHIGR